MIGTSSIAVAATEVGSRCKAPNQVR